MKIYYKKKNCGMTLIEVLVALLLFGLIFIAILPSFFVLGQSTIYTMGGKSQAVAQANEMMDYVYTYPYSSGETPDSVLANSSFNPDEMSNPPSNPTNNTPGYYVETVVNPANTDQDLYKVTIYTFYWDNSSSSWKHVTLKSIMPLTAQ